MNRFTWSFMIELHNFCIHYGLSYTVADGKIVLVPRGAT